MFGDRLKELRTKRGITQFKFAKELNIATGTIGNWEVNSRTPDCTMLIKIADYFDVSLDYLLGREDYFGNYYNRDKHTSLSEKDQHMIELFRGLLPEMQNVVMNMVEELYKTTTKV